MEMNSDSAITALGALAQEHRLALFRLLVGAGQNGMAAGHIAEDWNPQCLSILPPLQLSAPADPPERRTDRLSTERTMKR